MAAILPAQEPNVSRTKNFFAVFNKTFIDQAYSVKIDEWCTHSLFAYLWSSVVLWSTNM